MLFLLLFAYGVANVGVATAYATACEINPRHVAGTSMAFANMVSVLIGSSFHPLIGKILDINVIAELSTISFRTTLAILYLSLICTILAYCLWAYSLKRFELSKAGYYLYLEPVFTILVAPLFIGNQLTICLIIGGILIFIGLLLVNLNKLPSFLLGKRKD